MKVELNIDKRFGETIVTISTNKVNDEIQNLVNYIENKEDYFIGVLDGKVRLLNTEDIIRVYVEDRKVYVVTVEGRFIVRKKLYEVQSTLTKDFIKISQSEIANVKYIRLYTKSGAWKKFHPRISILIYKKTNIQYN